MPLPRYEGGATPFQQVQPMAAQAGAQLANNLSQRLSQWQDTIYKVGADQKAEEGRNQAIQDMTSGDPLKVEKGYGFYAKAYNEVSKAAYNAEVESDLKVKAEEYASMSKSDPEQFKAMFGEYVKKTVAGIQEPEFKALALTAGQKQLGTQYASLTKEAFKNRRENDIKAIDATIKDLESEYEGAFSNDDFDTTSEALAKMTALMEAKVKAGEMSQAMIPLEIKRIVNNGVKTKVMTELDNSLEAGESDYVQKFMSSDTYKQMPIDERTAFSKKMFEHIDNKFKATTEAFDSSVNLAEKMSKKTTMDLSAEIMSGKEVSEVKLKELLDSKKLLPAQYKEVMQLQADMKAGAIADNESVVMDYEIALEYVNPRTIASDPRLTAKTKQTLIGRAVSMQRQERADIRTANALANYKKTMGISPIQYGVDYAKGNLDIEDAAEKQRTVLKLKTKVLKRVENQEIDVTDFPDAMAEEVADFKKRNKDNSDSRKYDTAYNNYLDKLNTWQKNKNSTFNQIGLKLGEGAKAVGVPSKVLIQVTPPEPPKKPDNYIEKTKRVVQ